MQRAGQSRSTNERRGPRSRDLSWRNRLCKPGRACYRRLISPRPRRPCHHRDPVPVSDRPTPLPTVSLIRDRPTTLRNNTLTFHVNLFLRSLLFPYLVSTPSLLDYPVILLRIPLPSSFLRLNGPFYPPLLVYPLPKASHSTSL